jgi:hypothetical protein
MLTRLWHGPTTVYEGKNSERVAYLLDRGNFICHHYYNSIYAGILS